MNKLFLCFKVCVLLSLILVFACNKRDRNFASDISGITKVCLKQKSDSVFLEKQDKYWLINAEHKSNSLKVSNLLEILKYLDYEYPLSKTEAVRYSEKNFKSNGLNISLYKKNKIEKSIYLLFSEGRAYGFINGGKQAYAVYLPGSTISLEKYLIAENSFWLDNTLFEVGAEQIETIKVTDNINNKNSFIIECNKTNFKLLEAEGNSVNFPIDSTGVKRYISYYNVLYFKKYITELERKCLTYNNIYNIYITTNQATEHYSVLYKKHPDENIIYDRNEFFLVNNVTKDTLVANWINFDILLKSLSDFKKAN